MNFRGIPISIRGIVRRRYNDRLVGKTSSLPVKTGSSIDFDLIPIYLNDMVLNLQELLYADPQNVTNEAAIQGLRVLAGELNDPEFTAAIGEIETARNHLLNAQSYLAKLIKKYDQDIG